ncbi:MAG: hypothetical protein H6679_04775 [Epsilonproteobacteria bacterium]|nr:hypothetical protein [Campylobacterota bacterium]
MVVSALARMLSVFTCALFIVICCNHSVAQDAATLEDFFKNIDMEQLAKDMEKVFAEIEEMEQKEKAEKQRQTEEKTSTKSPQQAAPHKPPVPTSKTTKQLFLEPETMTIQQGGKTQTVPTPQSLQAAQEILSLFAQYTQKIDTRIQGSSLFGPEYQERFLKRFGKNIDAVQVASDHITSKRAYQSVLLTPPAQNKQLADQMQAMRKKIIQAINELEKAHEKIVATSLDAAQNEEDSDFDKLQQIKKQQEQQPLQSIDAPERQQKQRGKKYEPEADVDEDEIEHAVQEQSIPEKPTQHQPRRTPPQTDYFSYIMIALVILLLIGLGFISIQKFIASQQQENNDKDEEQGESKQDNKEQDQDDK